MVHAYFLTIVSDDHEDLPTLVTKNNYDNKQMIKPELLRLHIFIYGTFVVYINIISILTTVILAIHINRCTGVYF